MRLETWKRAHNMQVITLEEGVIIARLEDFQFDLEDHHIFGFSLKVPGMFSRMGRVKASSLVLIGQDVTLVSSQQDVHWTQDKKSRDKGRAWASQYLGVNAVTRRGRSLGAVQDYVIDGDGRRVTGLVLHGGRLLPLVETHVSTGPAAIIVPDEALVVDMPEDPDPNDEVGFWKRVRDSLKVGRRKQLAEGEEEGESLDVSDADTED